MRPGGRDFSKPHQAFPNYLKTWEPMTVAAPVTTNSQRLDALVHNGKIYLSLADAIVLGLENNYDIAIQRYNLDIADTDLLRARAGSNLLGVSSGLVQGTLGGSSDWFELAQLGRWSRRHIDCGWRRRCRCRWHRVHHQRHRSDTGGHGPRPYGNHAAGTDNDSRSRPLSVAAARP